MMLLGWGIVNENYRTWELYLIRGGQLRKRDIMECRMFVLRLKHWLNELTPLYTVLWKPAWASQSRTRFWKWMACGKTKWVYNFTVQLWWSDQWWPAWRCYKKDKTNGWTGNCYIQGVDADTRAIPDTVLWSIEQELQTDKYGWRVSELPLPARQPAIYRAQNTSNSIWESKQRRLF